MLDVFENVWPAPPDDDLPVRDAGIWTADKLAIVRYYLPGFARACSGRIRTFHFIDGFAGPGVNVIADERVSGSPLIALETSPKFASCILMDSSERVVEVLRARAAPYGSRAIVEKGDCNRDLLPLMGRHLGEWDPALVLLDPEGTELAWTTVEAIARFKTQKTKLEQLILLATHTGFLRMLAINEEAPDWAAARMTTLYGTSEWRDIYELRKANRLSTDEATTEYVKLYAARLRGLGYDYVIDREIRDNAFEGRLRYFLLFATQHDVGISIMRRAFDTVTSASDYQMTLFRRERTEE